MSKVLPLPKLFLFLLLFGSFGNGLYAQCVTQSSLAQASCGASVTRTGVGGKMTIPLTGTIGDSYCVSLDGGSNAFGAYSFTTGSAVLTYNFTATASTTNVNIYAGGGCNWSAGGSSAVLTYTHASVVNSTSNASICSGGTKTLSATASCGGFSPSWSVQSGGGSIAGNTYTAPTVASATTVTLRASLGSCYSDVSFTVTPNRTVGVASSTPTVCVNTVMPSITHTTTDVTGIASSTGLPPGVTATYAANTITISGTPTLSGTYNYTITPAGCGTANATGTIVVTSPPSITSVVATDALCNGGSSGTITVTASGGTGAHQYSIDNGATFQSSPVFNGLPVGSYNVVVRDALSCTSTYGANPIAVGQPTAILASATSTDASCSTVYDGTITVSASGGTSPYSYALNGGPSQTNNVFSGIASGTYTVNVTDNHGCPATASITVGEMYNVVAVLDSSKDVSCFSGNDGAIYVSLSGGVSPYEYSINGVIFQAAPSFTGLTVGNYTISLRDSRGCADYLSVPISQPNAITAVLDSTVNGLCAGSASAGIYISASGGTPPYTYLWSNGVGTQNLTGVVAGTYNVTVTDANGCTGTTGATVSQPLPLYLSIAQYNDVYCNGDSSGAIDITVNGGTPPFSFAWSNGETTEDIYHLPASATPYAVTVTDTNGCQQTISQLISEPTPFTTSVAINGPACTATGADITLSGGVAPYTVLWSNGSTTTSVTNLAAGGYTVTATDANGCVKVDAINIITTLYLSVAQYNDVYCNGDSSGAIDITVNGGTPPFSFAWSNGATTEDIQRLPASATPYTVTVTDANACQQTLSQTISEPAPFTTSVAINGSICSATGADITLSGGVAPYTVLWSNGSTTTTVTNLAAGGYTVTATDANGCVKVDAINIIAPLSLSTVVTNTICNGGADGAIDLTVTGGTPPYSYAWADGGVATEDRTALTQGVYTVTVTDNNACTATASATVNSPASMILVLTTTDVACQGGASGAIEVSVTGGTPTYSYAWSDGGAASQNRTGLAQGSYAVTVTDNNTCTATASATINSPTALNLVLSKTDVACQGGNTGSVTATVTGGTTPYSYLWTAGNSPYTASQTNVGGGQYCVQVTDSNGCVVTGCETVVGQPNPIYVTPSSKSPSCGESTDGLASVFVAGGQPPYTFAWNTTPVQTGNIATSLEAGTYTVTISDATGCSFTEAITLTSAVPISVTTSAANLVTCTNGADGVIVVSVTGGTAPYLYSLNTLTQVSDTFRNVSAGDYAVSVRDANGCVGTTTASITNVNGLLTVDLTSDFTTVLSGQAVQLTATAVSDSPIISYTWRADSATFDFGGCIDADNCNNPVVRPILSGNIIVTAIDSKGCATSDTIYIQIKPKGPDTYFVPTVFTPNGDGLNDRFEFNVLGANTANVQIWNRWGQLVYRNPQQPNGFSGLDGWDGTYGGKKAQFDTYTYQLELTFFDGHTETIAGTITVME